MLCRSSAAVAVLLVDLDNFRRFNQAGYREGGDRALLTAAQVLKENLRRQADRLYRMHGGRRVFDPAHRRQFREAFWQTERLRVALSGRRCPLALGSHLPTHRQPRTGATSAPGDDQQRRSRRNRAEMQLFPPEEPPTASAPLVASHARPSGFCSERRQLVWALHVPRRSAQSSERVHVRTVLAGRAAGCRRCAGADARAVRRHATSSPTAARRARSHCSTPPTNSPQL